MQRLEITVPDLNDSFSRVILDGTVYLMRFTWNESGGYWTFGLFTSVQEPIVQSVKIVPRFPLNIQYIDNRVPSGIFGVYMNSTNPEKERVSRDDFKDGTAIFAYISANQTEV